MGKAIDTLNHDYPLFFESKPDLSIYSENVQLIGESGGVRLSGKKAYRRLFDTFRWARSVGMLDEGTSIEHRLVVCDGSLRVRWSAALWMRDPAFGLTLADPVHADGVSVYDLDRRGLVIKHRLENVLLVGPHEQSKLAVEALWLPLVGGSVEGVPALAPRCSREGGAAVEGARWRVGGGPAKGGPQMLT